MPFTQIQHWIEEEKRLGSTQAANAVLATATVLAVPHCRLVAIREVVEESVLFFTQRGTRKVAEMLANPEAAMTIWLPLQAREVVLEGKIKPLTQKENVVYWETYPREAQLRFLAYAPTSGQTITSPVTLNEKLAQLKLQYNGQAIPMSADYCGFKLIPERLYFYSYLTDRLSEVIQYTKQEDVWKNEYLSP